MNIPPSRPSSSPPSKDEEGGPDKSRAKSKKDFRLPDKDKDKDEKKKSLFELAGGEAQEIKQDRIGKEEFQELKAEQLTGITAKAQVSQIGALIQKMVASMQIGAVGGRDFASLTLGKAGSEVPGAFAGSNLTLNYKENGLSIQFDHFADVQQETNAVFLVEKNKEQLVQMLQSCQAKNIQVTEFNIGSHSITLPRVQPLPPPFQPQEPGAGHTRQDRERQERQEGQDEGV